MAWLTRLAHRVGMRKVAYALSLYPPYLGAGIRVVHVSEDVTTIRVRMPLTPWNQNAVGTQFGGSLYAMCDPFLMVILMHHLGPEYVIWDKAASIRFLRPGRGPVTAEFHIPPEELTRIRAAADAEEKVEPEFTVEVKSLAGEVIARVEKTLSVRHQSRVRPRT